MAIVEFKDVSRVYRNGEHEQRALDHVNLSLEEGRFIVVLGPGGADENGNPVFCHEYTYAGPLSLAGMMDGYLFETADEDAGEFRYFFMMPDTPATTFHLEFRYGSDAEALTRYNEGPYAYWLAAGFPVDADEQMIHDVITLFCEENLAEMQAEDAA